MDKKQLRERAKSNFETSLKQCHHALLEHSKLNNIDSSLIAKLDQICIDFNIGTNSILHELQR